MTRWCLAVLCSLVSLAPAYGQLHAEARKQSVAYVRSLQAPAGGFLPSRPDPKSKVAPHPTLRATSAAIRALKYLGGAVPDRDACAKFVAACFDAESGGFRDAPGKGKPDVFSTAVGIMAVKELKMPGATYDEPAVKYLAEHAKSFGDIRIAVAGLEALKRPSPTAAAWLAEVNKKWNADGTAGKDDGVARETASVAVTLLRLGQKIKDRAAVLKAMRGDQRNNGGFGKEGAPVSDLETSYRVLRAFVMLKDRPEEVEALRSFVAKCRNDDGGYAVSPNEPSSVGATYFAAILLHWLERMEGKAKD